MSGPGERPLRRRKISRKKGMVLGGDTPGTAPCPPSSAVPAGALARPPRNTWRPRACEVVGPASGAACLEAHDADEIARAAQVDIRVGGGAAQSLRVVALHRA